MAPDMFELLADSRITHQYAQLNGCRYHYLLGQPHNGSFRATVFLIHGWPDLSAGWRKQIPFLLDLDLRVVAPDMMGYGGTDAPRVPPDPISLYSNKRAADDIAELARQLGSAQIILGGHDWGGMVVWRTALFHPELVSGVFAVCTPYQPPSRNFISLEQLTRGPLPQFAYQLQLAGPDVEASVQSEKEIRRFLNAVFGGKGPNREVGFNPEKGVLFENLELLGHTALLSDKELDYYVEQYKRSGLHGPLNWYRVREANFQDEVGLQKTTVDVPALLIAAERDNVLHPAMSHGMEKHVSELTRSSVDAGHWALVQKPNEVNGIIKAWLEKESFMTKSRL